MQVRSSHGARHAGRGQGQDLAQERAEQAEREWRWRWATRPRQLGNAPTPGVTGIAENVAVDGSIAWEGADLLLARCLPYQAPGTLLEPLSQRVSTPQTWSRLLITNGSMWLQEVQVVNSLKTVVSNTFMLAVCT